MDKETRNLLNLIRIEMITLEPFLSGLHQGNVKAVKDAIASHLEKYPEEETQETT